MRTKLGLAAVAVALLYMLCAPHAQAGTKATMEEAVNGWIEDLAVQEEFSDWRQAEWTSAPLGPGSHGFVVTLKQQGVEVGYLIVHAAQDGGWSLTEYGAGDQPLFSLSRLDEALKKQGAIPVNGTYAINRIYCSPFEAVFAVHANRTTFAVDAKSGELLPEGTLEAARSCEPVAANSHADSMELRPSSLMKTWDAFDDISWMAGKGAVKPDKQKLLSGLKQDERYVVRTAPFEQNRIAAYAIRGYADWTSKQYVAVEDFGPRYVPMEAVLQADALFRLN